MPEEIKLASNQLEEERKLFEDEIYAYRFLKGVTMVPGKQFWELNCPERDEFLRKNADGTYVEDVVEMAWWGWLERAKKDRMYVGPGI